MEATAVGVEAAPRRALLFQMVGDRIRGPVPVVARVPISPAAAEQDQRHDRAIDQKGGVAAVVAVTRIDVAVLVVGAGRICRLGIPRWRVAGLLVSGGRVGGLLVFGLLVSGRRRISRLGIAVARRRWISRLGGVSGRRWRLLVAAAQGQQQGCQHNTTTHPRSSCFISQRNI
jgi:hypothetical protein